MFKITSLLRRHLGIGCIYFPVEALTMENPGIVYDLCVVGAGLVGSAAARHASVNPNFTVCLIGPLEPTEKEKPERSIFSCHYDEGRITRIFDPLPESRILNRNSISRYHEVEELSGIRFHWPVSCLFLGKRGSDLTEAAFQTTQSLLTMIDATSNFKLRFPFLELRDDDQAFLESSPAGYISARKLVAAQQTVAQMQGCVFLPEVVEKVVEEGKQENELLTITTESGKKICARKVLLCTNTFTNFKQLLPEGKVVNLEYEKSQVSLIKLSDKEAERLIKMPSMIYKREDEDTVSEDFFCVYVLPPIKYPDGNWYVKIGWDPIRPEEGLKDLKEIRNWYLGSGLPDRTELMTKIMKRLTPGLRIESYNGMTCSTCHTTTKLPYIDMVTSKLGVAIGGCGTSAKSSDEVGRIAVELVTNNTWSSELDRERFRVQWK